MGNRTRKIAEILGRANHSTGKIASDNLDVNFTNTTFSGTEGITIPTGTTAQRGTTTGQWRFNTETNYFEGRNSSGFASVAPAPTISSVDVSYIDSASGGTTNIVLSGTNFANTDTVALVPNSGSNITPNSYTHTNASSKTINVTDSDFVNANEPYSIVITGLGGSYTLSNQIYVDTAPAFTTAAGSLGTIDHTQLAGTYTLTSLAATDDDGDTVSYSQPSGSLPSGLSLNSSTGAWSGTVARIPSTTTFNFTGRATSTNTETAVVKTSDRSFSITQEGELDNYGTQYALSLNNDFNNDGNGASVTASARMSFDTASRGANFNTYMANCWDTGGQSYFYLPAGNDINFGTGDFTIEFWVYLGSSTSGVNTSCRMFQMGGNDVNGIACIYNPNTGEFTFSNTHSNVITDNPSNWVDGWHYATFTSESGTKKLWRDGTLVGSSTSFNSINIGTSENLYFGVYPGDTGGATGWSTARFQEIQVTKGVAKYTSNFTVPTTAFIT